MKCHPAGLKAAAAKREASAEPFACHEPSVTVLGTAPPRCAVRCVIRARALFDETSCSMRPAPSGGGRWLSHEGQAAPGSMGPTMISFTDSSAQAVNSSLGA